MTMTLGLAVGLVFCLVEPSVADPPAAAATDAAVIPADVPRGTYRRSDALVWTALGFGVLHHVDHVVRGNHSGFPFTDKVTPFTPTLLIYPLVLGGIYLDAGPLYWTIFDSAALLGLVAVHATLEPPADVYDPWAEGTNRPGLHSPAMGVAALGVLAGLTITLGAHLASSIADGARHGFAWKRRREKITPATNQVAVGVTPTGLMTLSGRW